MTISFPKIDPTALRVVWAPLLVRPIARGPECFVAAIAAQSHSGQVGAYPLFDRRRVGVLFEDHADTLTGVLDASLDSLRRHLESEIALDGWSSPFEGVALGNPATAYVHRFSEVFEASMREARAHLWNLSLVAEAPDLLIRPNRLELFAGVRIDDSRARGVIEELAVEAKCRHVGVTRVESSEHAAEQIVAIAA